MTQVPSAANMTAAFHVVIPARYGSTRLPGKPLLKLNGKAMVVHVCEQAQQSQAASITVATDHSAIVDTVTEHGFSALLTSLEHASGTDRAGEIAERKEWADDAIVVNVQGDEPLMPAACVQQVAHMLFANPQWDIATLCEPVTSQEQVNNQNIVQVVADDIGRALYFSRAAIPWNREASQGDLALAQRHIGLYAYRVKALKQLCALPESSLEQTEKLEQLRAMQAGMSIGVQQACQATGVGVDTQHDVAAVEALLAAQKIAD